MQRAHKIRIYPNAEQAAILRQHVGAARFVYNWGLEHWNKWLEENKAGLRDDKPNWMKLSNLWTAERPEWAKLLPRHTVAYSLHAVNLAFVNFFQKRAGAPVYKKRGKCKAAFMLANAKQIIRDDGLHIHISKVKKDIRMAEKLRLKGKILNYTVSCVNGLWYVSVNVDVEDNRSAPDTVCGVDVGMKTPAVCSDGTILTLPVDKLTRLDKRLRSAQRRWSRTKKESRRRERALFRKRRIQDKINNIRRDAIHKFTSAVCKNHATVVVESLNARGMHHCPRHIRSGMQRSCMSLVLQQIGYKAINIVKAAMWYPSTQLCSQCGSRQKLTLRDRVYKCPACGLVIDRDLNAAINLSKYPGSPG